MCYRTCGNMGYYADKSRGRGQMYLTTRDEEPFCGKNNHFIANHYGICKGYFPALVGYIGS